MLASVYATLIAKVHRVRGAANADTLRCAESASENEAILAALTDKDQDDLPRILHEHAENAAREVLALLRRANLDGADPAFSDREQERASS